MTQTSMPLPPLLFEKVMSASPERVFQAWTIPEEITQWFICGHTKMQHADIDLRIGGSYRFLMNSEEGPVCQMFGKYLEIEPGKKLVFTWSNDHPEHSRDETVVTLLFAPQGDATLVKLTHSGFTHEPTRDDHNEGWIVVVENLAAHFPA